MKKALQILAFAFLAGVSASGQDFAEQEMSVTANDGLSMGATLTVPPTDRAPKAVIVLATGNGTQNRDEEILGKKPFKTLAEYLSCRGYAVLRVDDRGFDRAEDAKNATMHTFADDVAAAVTRAAGLFPGIPVGIIGHSCGGSYAVINAARNPGIGFIVTLAAPAWRGDSLIMSQTRAIAMQASGSWDAEPLQRQLMAIARSEAGDVIAGVMLVQAISEHLGKAAELPQVRQQVAQQVEAILTPWYRSMRRYDPADDITAVRVPWLALNGSRDMQVLPENLATIRTLNPGAETVLLDGHNHLFQQCRTGMPQEYASIAEDLSPQTLEQIVRWLDKTLRQ